MADNKFIQTFESHRASNKAVETEKVEQIVETVKQVDDIYKVGSINIPQSLINSYVKKVKDETGKNLRQLYSDMEIAEELVKYAVDTHLNSDDLPVSALLGGADEEGDDLGTDIEPTEEEEILSEEPAEEEAPAEEDTDLELDDESEADLDLDEPEAEGGDEFEEPAEGEDDEEAPAEEEGGDEEAELPI